jgi:hypothetical protein
VKRNFRLVATAAAVVLLYACTKIKSTDLGTGLIPPVDGVTTKDTVLEVFSVNAGRDTLRAGFSNDYALGYVNDPLFGRTTASINLELKPGTGNAAFGFEVGKDSLQLDSVILALHYKSTWADSTQPLRLQVYEIAQGSRMKADSDYLSTTHFATTGGSLNYNGAAVTVDPRRLNDSLHLFREDAAGQIRIRLNNELGNRFLKLYDSSNAYRSDSAFSTYFAGFQVKPEASGNALLKVSLTGSNTKLALYYRYTNRSGGTDTAVRYFRFTYNNSLLGNAASANAGHANTIDRDWSGTELAAHFPAPPSLRQDSLLYIQAAPGLFSRLSIPGLSGLPNMVVHRAELLMEQVPDPASDQRFSPPALFVAAYTGDDPYRRFAMSGDIQFFQGGAGVNLYNSGYGGLPVSRKDSGGNLFNAYTINLSRYVQGIVTRKEPNYNLVLYAPYPHFIYTSPALTSAVPVYARPLANEAFGIATGRVRLGGGSHSRHRMRLRIVYSLI